MKSSKTSWVYFLFFIIVIPSWNSCNVLRLGKFPDNPKEVDLDVFIPLWIENHSETKIPHWNLRELSRDSLFAYFHENDVKVKVYLKVPIKRLNEIDYLSIDGESIGKSFYKDIIPSTIKDRKKVQPKERHFSNFTYEYIDSTKLIKISCLYFIKNENGKKIVKNTYTATYSISDKSLMKD